MYVLSRCWIIHNIFAFGWVLQTREDNKLIIWLYLSEKSKTEYQNRFELIIPSGKRLPYNVRSSTIRDCQALWGAVRPYRPYGTLSRLWVRILSDQAVSRFGNDVKYYSNPKKSKRWAEPIVRNLCVEGHVYVFMDSAIVSPGIRTLDILGMKLTLTSTSAATVFLHRPHWFCKTQTIHPQCHQPQFAIQPSISSVLHVHVFV